MNNKPNLPTAPKPSQRQKARDLSARVDSLETTLEEMAQEAIPQFMFVTDQRMGVFQNQQSHQAEIIDALVGLIGEDNVLNAIAQNRLSVQVKRAEERRARVLKALEDGKIEPEEVIRGVKTNEKGEVEDGGSYIAFVTLDAKGVEIPYSYACVPVGKLVKPEHQLAVAGQKAGFEIEVDVADERGQPQGKGKMVLLGVYKDKASPVVAVVPDPDGDAPDEDEVPPAEAGDTQPVAEKTATEPTVEPVTETPAPAPAPAQA